VLVLGLKEVVAPSGAVNARVQEPAGPLTLRYAVAMALQANPGL